MLKQTHTTMEPPSKRPRLSIFESSATGEELETARQQNDLLLKTKWEAIFEKYSRDFSDIGDEIDVMTGRVVVNRGHLEGMETETDPGQFDSKTFLRIISAAQENGDPFPYTGIDGILPSIETMAEHAVERLSPSDGEGMVARDSSDTSMNSRSSSTAEEAPLEPYESDCDSLFAQDGPDRESSVDSLFDEANGSFMRQESSVSEAMGDKSSSVAADLQDDDHIMAKFGPSLGQEVLNLLEQRQQAHIEPAWRIPIAVEPAVVRRSTPKHVELPPRSASPPRDRARSIWAVQPDARSPSESPPMPSRIRYESVDPLQEGFTEKQAPKEDVYSSDGYVEENKDTEDEEEQDHETESVDVTNLIEASRSGTCTFCDRYFRDKSGVMAHWDRLLKKVKKLRADDPHDCGAIREVRSRVTRRVRLRRLTVGDFKAMVEFHEGAGLSFSDIATSKVLRTRKTGPQLQDIYDRHRTPHHLRETPEPLRQWPPEEDKIILEMSDNPLTTIATLRRGVKSRSELQIGNRLADLWVKQLNNETKAPTTNIQHIKEEPMDDLFC